MKPNFPSWAPADLIAKYEELEKQIASADGGVLEDLFPGRSKSCEGWIVSAKRKQRVLERLLTDENMESIWRFLDHERALEEVQRYKLDRVLWDLIGMDIEAFPALLAKSQPRAKKRETLLAAREKLVEAIAEINKSSHAIEMQRKVVSELLAQRAFASREMHGEKVWAAELTFPHLAMTLDADIVLRDAHLDDELSEASRERPMIERLAYWVKATAGLPLLDVLQHLADALDAEADQPDPIRQPGTGYAAIRPMLTRRVVDFMRWAYGSPHYSKSAVILTAVCEGLDLIDGSNPITADSIKDY